MSTSPEASAEGELIKAALRRSGISARRAADLTGISEGRWRQIANGYQTVRKGLRVPVTAPPDTLARMAHTVGVTPQQLTEAGREDAADVLREIQRQEAERDQLHPALSDPDERVIWEMDISEASRRAMIEMLRRDKERQRNAS